MPCDLPMDNEAIQHNRVSYLLCSSGFSLARRPRFFWTSHPLELIPEATFEFRTSGTVIQAAGSCEPVVSWLPVPWNWPAGEANDKLRFPSFTAACPKAPEPWHWPIVSGSRLMFKPDGKMILVGFQWRRIRINFLLLPGPPFESCAQQKGKRFQAFLKATLDRSSK